MQEVRKKLNIKYPGVLYIVATESVANNVLRTQVLEYMKDLSKSGIRFILVGFVNPKDIISFDEVIDLKKDLAGHKIQTHIYSKSHISIVYFFQLLWLLLKSIEIVLFNKIHVIQGRGYMNCLLGLVLKYLFSIKLVIDWRGIPNEEMVMNNRWKENGMVFRVGMRLEKFVIERADHVFCVSESLVDYMHKRGIRQANTDIIPSCPSESFFLSTVKAKGTTELDERLDNKFVLVYSGSLGKWNLIEPMLDFFSTALERIDVHFLFLTPDVDLAWEFFDQRNLPPNSHTILKSSHEDIPIYLARSDLALLLRENSVVNYVASPVKVGEYLACGVPVVSTPYVGDFRKLVSEYDVGFVVNPQDMKDNSELLAGILRTVKNNREHYRQTCKECARIVFRRGNYTHKYINTYTGGS